jgi:hypothetical protein
MSNSASDEDRRIVQEIAGRFGAPAFVRRARLVETSWTQLLEHGGKLRLQRLDMVGLRLGQLLALAGAWEALHPLLPEDADRTLLIRLHDELQPRLRMALQPSTSERVLRAALRELVEAMEIFNGHWKRWLAEVDLTPINKARENYNRYYLLEKECALGSALVARRDFKPLPPITRADVEVHLPLLALPRVA